MNGNGLEGFFGLKAKRTTVRRECVAGLTTFMTMAYVLVVIPQLLSTTGMDQAALFSATVFASMFATLVMALYANMPYALAPGLGLTAFFAYTVVGELGYSWQTALTAVFIEGLLFILLTVTHAREAIVRAIPANLKQAISVGIGLFITLIALNNAEIVQRSSGTLLRMGDLLSPQSLVCLIGLFIIAVLFYFRVQGALLLGILAATLLGIPLGVTHLPEHFTVFSLPPSIEPVFGKVRFEFDYLLSPEMALVVLTMVFVDLFDTLGSLIGVTNRAGLADRDGNVPGLKKALLSDAVGTTVGSLLGVSTVTTYLESAAGVAAGGRSGLTALVVALLFGVALFFSPVFLIVPAAALSAGMLMVGLFMMSAVSDIDFRSLDQGLPAFLTVVMMPFTYSIANGLLFGMLSFVILKLCVGKAREVTLSMYIVALFLLIKLFL